MRNKKLLVISQNFPPELTASTVLVNNIFKYYEGSLEAIGGFVAGKYDPEFIAPCPTYYLIPPNNYYIKRLYYKITPLFRFINKFLMKRLVKKIKPEIIFGNYPEIEFFISSYEVAQELNIPFYAYFHDLWEENMHKSNLLKLAQKWEPIIVRNSKRVICCTEKQQEYFKTKYNIETSLLLHPVQDEFLKDLKFIRKENGKEKRIVFVGSLSKAMNQDAMLSVCEAIDKLPEEFKLFWYPISEINNDDLINIGFNTKRIKQIIVPSSQLKAELQQADILIAPLSFKNCSALEVNTVFSNKVLSYLTSGRPILVYGPADSYHSMSAKKNGWAEVVDKDDVKLLSEKIMSLCSDIELQEKLVLQSIKEAGKRRSSKIAANLTAFINEDLIKQ